MVSPNEVGNFGGEGKNFSSWKDLMGEESDSGDLGGESEIEGASGVSGESEDDSDMKIYTPGGRISAKMPEIEEGVDSDFVRGWREAWEKKQQISQRGLDEKPSEATKVVSVEIEREKGPIFEVGAFGISAAEIDGKNGPESEDAFFISKEDGVFGVFDGVGGGPKGGEAAEIAQQTLEEMNRKYWIKDSSDLVNVAEWMHRNVQDRGVGTTTAVLVKIRENEEGGKELHFASFGDSRLYLLRDGELTQLTTDESVTEEDLDKAGIFDEEEREAFLKHGVKNVIGIDGRIKPDERNFGRVDLQSGDRIVLCTDGVTGDVEEERMSPETMKGLLDANQGDDQMAAKMLVLSAKKRDDRTAIVISV